MLFRTPLIRFLRSINTTSATTTVTKTICINKYTHRLQIQNIRNMTSITEKSRQEEGLSVIDIVKKDHHDAIEQHNIYKTSTNKEEKKHAAQMAIKLIAVHSCCEEIVLYPLFRTKMPDGNSIADQFLQEHQELKNDLYDLDKMSIDDPGFDAKFNRVVEEVNTHGLVHEEQDILPKFAQYCTEQELIDIGKAFIAQRAMVPTHPHPSAPTNPILQKVVGTATLPFDKMKDAAEGV